MMLQKMQAVLYFFESSNEDALKAADFINKKIKERTQARSQTSNVSVEKSYLGCAEELEKLFSLKEKA